MAAHNRRRSLPIAIAHPVIPYRASFAEGYELARWASLLERVAQDQRSQPALPELGCCVRLDRAMIANEFK
jgi:hypothetical protein